MKDRIRKFSLADRLRSFRYAFTGIKELIADEHNFRIHLFAAILVIICGIIYEVSPLEWILLSIVIGIVISAEIFNSAIEKLADFVSPEHNKIIGKVKDMSAAAVLVLAVVSVIVGLIIFLPKMF